MKNRTKSNFICLFTAALALSLYIGFKYIKIDLSNNVATIPSPIFDKESFNKVQKLHINSQINYEKVILSDFYNLLLLDATEFTDDISWEVKSNISCMFMGDYLLLAPKVGTVVLHINKNGKHSQKVINFIK